MAININSMIDRDFNKEIEKIIGVNPAKMKITPVPNGGIYTFEEIEDLHKYSDFLRSKGFNSFTRCDPDQDVCEGVSVDEMSRSLYIYDPDSIKM